MATTKKRVQGGDTPPPPPAPLPEGEARYTVIRDTREKDEQGWNFSPSKNCAGTVDGTLPTGDYTIQGFETAIVIERKGSIAEFAGNLYQARFVRELERLRQFPHAFIVLEFSFDDVLNFPASSSIPRSRWRFLRITPNLFVRRIAELQQMFPTVQFIFAGSGGKLFAASHFKRIFSRGPAH